MNSPMHLLHRLLVLVTGFIALASAANSFAADANLGAPQGSVPVPASLSKDAVQGVIIETFVGRAWAIQEKADGKVVGYLKHRHSEATVTMVYDDKQVSLYSVGYEIDKTTGARKEPKQPEGWLKNLRSDLAKRLNKATAAALK